MLFKVWRNFDDANRQDSNVLSLLEKRYTFARKDLRLENELIIPN